MADVSWKRERIPSFWWALLRWRSTLLCSSSEQRGYRLRRRWTGATGRTRPVRIVGAMARHLAPERRVILLTVFHKTRGAETAEVARPIHAQKICENEHRRAHQVFDRKVT